jgi:hypothetical protein
LYRGLTLAIAASWTSLARQRETMDELFAIWSEASSAAMPDTIRRGFRYARGLVAMSVSRRVRTLTTTHAQPDEGIAMSASDALSKALIFCDVRGRIHLDRCYRLSGRPSFWDVLTSADRFGSIGIERRFRVAKLDELLLGKRRR